MGDRDAVIVRQLRPPVKPVKRAVPQRANAVAAGRNAQAADVLKVAAADDKVAQAVAAVTVDMAVAAKVVADEVEAPEQVVHGQPKRSWLRAKNPRPRSPKP